MDYSSERIGEAVMVLANRAGKYLTFRLADQEYGVEILHVQEIIGLMNVTHVPRTPHYVRGVINLRGRVIPIVDLRAKFGMESKEDSERTCIIVVQVNVSDGVITMGFVVDEVSEVLDIKGEDIENPPVFGNSGLDTSYILGMAKMKGDVKILVDINKVLDVEELENIQTAM
jgi:purine-binding chemotaxis protein CheW